MILPIHTYGDSILNGVCKNINIESIDEINKIKILISDMYETLDSISVISLSAIEIGFLYNIFIIKDNGNVFFNTDNIFINCKIIDKSVEKIVSYEKCLTLPTIEEKLLRYKWVEIEYYDLDFNKQIKRFDGELSNMIQHNFDHTHGILLLSRLQPLIRKKLNKQLIKIKNKRIKTEYKIFKIHKNKTKC